MPATSVCSDWPRTTIPGTEYLEDWPSWTLPVLKWGKEQGGVVGYSHSGWGLALPDVMPGRFAAIH